MPNYPIKREALTVGVRIEAVARPNAGKIYEMVAEHLAGTRSSGGHTLSFTEYDFRELDSGRLRAGFTLNYINRYFKLLPTATQPA
jgi:hypothetical protein